MNRKHLLNVGVGLIVFGAILSLLTSRITGAAINELIRGPIYYGTGFWLLIAGVVLIGMAEVLERRVLKEVRHLDQKIRGGGTIHYREALQMAKGLGYSVRHGSNHDKVYGTRGNLITQISHGNGEIPTGTARKVLKALRENYREAA